MIYEGILSRLYSKKSGRVLTQEEKAREKHETDDIKLISSPSLILLGTIKDN